MREIVGVCLSQFHDDENSFELLVAYADGREVGHLVTRTNAQRIAQEFANEFPAALAEQTQQGVEVKASPADVFQVLAEFYRNGQFDFGHAPEMSRRISSLVDVPAVESEPVAALQTVSQEDLQEALALLPSVMRPSMSARIIAAISEQADIIARFKRTSRARRLAFEAASSAHPPRSLSNEGSEIDAAAIEAGAKILAKWIGYAWGGLSDRDISDTFPDWSRNGIGALGMQGGKPALRKVSAAILALSTRKGSAGDGAATGTNGGDHG